MKRTISLVLLVVIGLLPVVGCGQKAPNWQEQYDLGVRYLSEGNYEDAIIAFTAAIEIDPNRAEAYVGRGDAYIKSGETLSFAQMDYEQAIELDETLVEAYLGLADVYSRQGMKDKAQQILQEGQEHSRDDSRIDQMLSEMEPESLLDSSYSVFIAPEVDVAQADAMLSNGYYEGTEQYCSYKILDDETGTSVVTFGVPVDDMSFYGQDAIRTVAQTKKYLVAEIWLGPQNWTTISFDKQTNRILELPFSQYHELNDAYLIGTDLVLDHDAPDYLRLYSMEGELVQSIEDSCLFLTYNVVDNNIYYGKGAESAEEYITRLNESQDWESPNPCQIWRYEISSGQKEMVYELNCWNIEEIGKDYVTYYESFDSVVRTAYF